MKGNLIGHIKLNGHFQMALDKFLLYESLLNSDFSVIARFYSWEGNWLSIGKNQTKIPNNWYSLEKQQKIKIVRRPTGGDAVLHSGGLTYSLIWQNPPKKKKEAYMKASQWLINGFSNLGIPLEFGKNKPAHSSSNCFSTATIADLIDKNGFKRIGSAQFWQKGHLLQHGEILLEPPQDLWFELFQSKPPTKMPIQLPITEIENTLSTELISYWKELNWSKSNLDKGYINKIKSLIK
tara:strand:+ start:4679 stop:5389 length:711 start_codon:yes stop_codon:yes gene_type:complete